MTEKTDNAEILSRKAEIRRSFLARRREMDSVARQSASSEIGERLRYLPELASTCWIAFYSAFDHEVDLNNLIAEYRERGKRILLPRFNRTDNTYEMVEIEKLDSDTVPGHYNILEPRPEFSPCSNEALRSLDIAWLVPGVAFDLHGRRLGRGCGYYDRLLEKAAGCRIGIAYDWQIIRELPNQPYDQEMDILVSEKRLFRIPQAWDREQ